MMLFYGWTDLLLLNMAHTKLSFHENEQTDLYVLMLPRVSEQLVSLIEDSGIFNNVYKVHGKFAPLTKYDVLFTGAFWADSLVIFKYMPGATINIVEEGTSHYNKKGRIYWYSIGWKRHYHRLKFFNIIRKAKKAINKVYVYEPRLCNYKNTVQLPKLDIRIINILKSIDVNLDDYKADVWDLTNMHPTTQPKRPMLEAVIAQLDKEQIEAKTIVSPNSSVLINVGNMFGYKPKLVFTKKDYLTKKIVGALPNATFRKDK